MQTPLHRLLNLQRLDYFLDFSGNLPASQRPVQALENSTTYNVGCSAEEGFIVEVAAGVAGLSRRDVPGAEEGASHPCDTPPRCRLRERSAYTYELIHISGGTRGQLSQSHTPVHSAGAGLPGRWKLAQRRYEEVRRWLPALSPAGFRIAWIQSTTASTAHKAPMS